MKKINTMEKNEASKENYYLIKGILPKRNNQRKEKKLFFLE